MRLLFYHFISLKLSEEFGQIVIYFLIILCHTSLTSLFSIETWVLTIRLGFIHKPSVPFVDTFTKQGLWTKELLIFFAIFSIWRHSKPLIFKQILTDCQIFEKGTQFFSNSWSVNEREGKRHTLPPSPTFHLVHGFPLFRGHTQTTLTWFWRFLTPLASVDKFTS